MANVGAFIKHLSQRFGCLFDARRTVSVVRVPGRIDFMGGIGDYSGCLVLQGLIDKATCLAIQTRRDRLICVESASAAKEGLSRRVQYTLDEIFPAGEPLTYSKAHRLFTADPETAWSAYVIGGLIALVREGLIEKWNSGFSLAIDGTVPFGGGVSSSASVEMAALAAFAQLAGLKWMSDRALALHLAVAGQIVENRIAGAPCGIMDQIAVTLGSKDALLPIVCRPFEVLVPISVPDDLRIVGINSNIKHAIGGAHYTDTRVATFMGHRILAKRFGRPDGNFYLSEISPAEWLAGYKSDIPQRLSGSQFLKQYGKSFDLVTKVNPDKVYCVRSRTEHPIYEQRRVEEVVNELQAYTLDRDRRRLSRIGECMYSAHWSYGKRCGLGSAETDLIVNLARERGEKCGIYGAKISGGGSGGTVALLIDRKAEHVVREIASQYERETGIKPDLFLRSSPGAMQFGVQRIRLNADS